jgi:hypothetical protein
MPYISTDQVKEIRNSLKKKFPNWKFSVRKDNSSVRVSVLSSPLAFPANSDYPKLYRDVNHYYIEDGFQLFPKWVKALVKIKDIVGGNQKTLYMDSDYGNIPNYYYNLSIGSYEKPYTQK